MDPGIRREGLRRNQPPPAPVIISKGMAASDAAIAITSEMAPTTLTNVLFFKSFILNNGKSLFSTKACFVFAFIAMP